MPPKNHFFTILLYLASALALRFAIADYFFTASIPWWLQIIGVVIVFAVGIVFIFRGTAQIIEETTDVLKDRTKLAGGLLQSFGTAFPDMIIGVLAAIISLQVKDADYVRAINLAIIAASTTFGSNIYNILHAFWCVLRQNMANAKNRQVPMFPGIPAAGTVKPFKEHNVKPSLPEMDKAIRILTALTLLTAFVGVNMVLFGQTKNHQIDGMGDLYQLIQPVGIVLFLLCAGVLYYFRKNRRPETLSKNIAQEEHFYSKHGTWRISLDLVVSGIAILFAAESMIKAMEVFSGITHTPFVITGIAAGIIGCFGEIIVIHNFSINPKGRIGDAIVGVAMDNIVTTLGASIVAVMGGIFLGSNALILIFIIILAGNTMLIEQISLLKNSLSKK